MDVSREAVTEAAIGAVAVAVFVAAIVVISQTYAINGHLDPSGGFALVGSIALFVVVVTALGFWLERQDF